MRGTTNNLEYDIKHNKDIIALCSDKTRSEEFYAALCNTEWSKFRSLMPDEQIVAKIKGVDPTIWGCSWRHAGGILAEIRCLHHGVTEDYMDFYCSGNEGTVTDTVMVCFDNLGWTLYEVYDI